VFILHLIFLFYHFLQIEIIIYLTKVVIKILYNYYLILCKLNKKEELKLAENLIRMSSSGANKNSMVRKIGWLFLKIENNNFQIKLLLSTNWSMVLLVILQTTKILLKYKVELLGFLNQLKTNWIIVLKVQATLKNFTFALMLD
jgi:hypothetical protein